MGIGCETSKIAFLIILFTCLPTLPLKLCRLCPLLLPPMTILRQLSPLSGDSLPDWFIGIVPRDHQVHVPRAHLIIVIVIASSDELFAGCVLAEPSISNVEIAVVRRSLLRLLYQSLLGHRFAWFRARWLLHWRVLGCSVLHSPGVLLMLRIARWTTTHSSPFFFFLISVYYKIKNIYIMDNFIFTFKYFISYYFIFFNKTKNLYSSFNFIIYTI